MTKSVISQHYFVNNRNIHVEEKVVLKSTSETSSDHEIPLDIQRDFFFCNRWENSLDTCLLRFSRSATDAKSAIGAVYYDAIDVIVTIHDYA